MVEGWCGDTWWDSGEWWGGREFNSPWEATAAQGGYDDVWSTAHDKTVQWREDGLLEELRDIVGAGQRLLDNGRTQGALRYLERAWATLEPSVRKLRVNAGESRCLLARSLLPALALCHLKGDPPAVPSSPTKALELCEEALHLFPNNAEAWFRKSEALNMLGRDNEAQMAFDKAAEFEPSLRPQQRKNTAQPQHEDVLREMHRICNAGKDCFRKGNVEEAQTAFEKGLAHQWYYEELWDMRHGHNKSKVEDELRKMIVTTLSNLAQCHLSVKPALAQKALDCCEEALRRDPSCVKALFRKGKAFLLMHEYLSAFAAFSRAAELAPSDTAILENLASSRKLAQQQQQHLEARQGGPSRNTNGSDDEEEETSATERMTRSAHPNRGGIRRVLGNAREMQTPRAAAPQSWRAQKKTGGGAHEDGDSHDENDSVPDPCGEELKEGFGPDSGLCDVLAKVQKLRRDGRAHFDNGHIILAASCFEEAVLILGTCEGQWRKGVLLDEDTCTKPFRSAGVALLTNLAQCYLLGEEPEWPPEPQRALACCQEALDLEACSVKALFRKGRALFAMRRFAEAEAAFLSAARLEPQNANIRQHLAMARESARPSCWPEESFPTPVGALGPEAMEESAEGLTDVLVEQGLGGYTRHLLLSLLLEVERFFGIGAGKHLVRVVPLVQRMAHGEKFQYHDPEKGPRSVMSYVEGLLPEQPWHEASDYSWSTSLASGTRTFRQELLEEERREQEFGSSLWEFPDEAIGMCQGEVVNLLRQGVWIAGERFRETRRLLSILEGFRPYDVSFVRIPSRSRGPLYVGDSNCVLVVHLGLDLEEGRCNTLRVGSKTCEWHVGDLFLFDHTYAHSARNSSSRDRITLACRFYHPDITEVERYALLYLANLMSALQGIPKWKLATLLATETTGPGSLVPKGGISIQA